jgi:hypothetical protein
VRRDIVSDDFGELEEMGPVDFLVIEFPKLKMNGEAMKHLIDLVDRRNIRVLDLLFVRKDADGTVGVVAISDFDSDGTLDLAVFEGASSGLLGDDDLREAAEALEPGAAGAVLVYENLWAAPLARSLRKNGAQFVAGGRVPVQALLASIEALDAQPA